MSTLNARGIAFVHARTGRMAVNSTDDAEKVLVREIARGPAPGTTPEEWARNLAWIIGFDTLIGDRTAIRNVVELVVSDALTGRPQ